MAKAVPTASFRRPQVDPSKMAAFIGLDDAPGDAPLPEPTAKLSLVEPPVEAAAPVTTDEPSDVETNNTAPVAQVEGKKSPRAERSKWRRKILHRADGRELRKHTFYLEAELSHQLTVTCAHREYDLSEAIEEAVALWLKKKSA